MENVMENAMMENVERVDGFKILVEFLESLAPKEVYLPDGIWREVKSYLFLDLSWFQLSRLPRDTPHIKAWNEFPIYTRNLFMELTRHRRGRYWTFNYESILQETEKGIIRAVDVLNECLLTASGDGVAGATKCLELYRKKLQEVEEIRTTGYIGRAGCFWENRIKILSENPVVQQLIHTACERPMIEGREVAVIVRFFKHIKNGRSNQAKIDKWKKSLQEMCVYPVIFVAKDNYEYGIVTQTGSIGAEKCYEWNGKPQKKLHGKVDRWDALVFDRDCASWLECLDEVGIEFSHKLNVYFASRVEKEIRRTNVYL
jgi:hypothetical protein